MIQGSQGAQQAIHNLERLAVTGDALVSYNLAVSSHLLIPPSILPPSTHSLRHPLTLFQVVLFQQLFARAIATTQSILANWKSSK